MKFIFYLNQKKKTEVYESRIEGDKMTCPTEGK